MWDDESPGSWDDGDGPDARRASRPGGSRDVGGDDIVPHYGGSDLFGDSMSRGAEADSRAAAGGPRTAGGRAALLVVLVVAILTTLVLCCVSISQAARLLNVDPSLF